MSEFVTGVYIAQMHLNDRNLYCGDSVSDSIAIVCISACVKYNAVIIFSSKVKLVDYFTLMV